VADISDLPAEILAEIKHFFDIYKDLEPGKFSVTGDFHGKSDAWAEIRASQARHRDGQGEAHR
jgi:inorganic pyrophosphatase